MVPNLLSLEYRLLLVTCFWKTFNEAKVTFCDFQGQVRQVKTAFIWLAVSLTSGSDIVHEHFFFLSTWELMNLMWKLMESEEKHYVDF